MKKDTRLCAVIAIIALAQILGEDLALLGGYSLFVRRLFICVGLFCDLFFTAQFLVGLYTASLNRKARRYFFMEGGWMDFLAGVPLLVLNSGPAVFGLAAGVPLVPIAARIGSSLRFLRFLKIFRIVPFGAAGSGAPAFLVSVLIIAGAFLGPVFFRGGFTETQIKDGYISSALSFAQAASGGAQTANAAHEYAKSENALLLLKQETRPLYSRYAPEYYKKYYGQQDYLWRRQGALDFFFGLKPLLAEDARRNLAYFCVLAVLMCAIILSSRMRARRENP